MGMGIPVAGNPDKRFGRITDLRRGVTEYVTGHTICLNIQTDGSCVTETVCCVPAMAKPEKFEHQVASVASEK